MVTSRSFRRVQGFGVIGAAWLAIGTGLLRADDGDRCDDTGSVAGPFFSEFSNHPGLLGKNYVDLRYHRISSGDLRWLRRFDDSLSGLIVTGNSPLAAFDQLPGPLRYDLFSEFQFRRLDGDHYLGSPVNATAQVESQLNQLGLGLTAYYDRMEGFRPFVQLGVQFWNLEEVFQVPAHNYVSLWKDSGTTLLFNMGAEVDLLDRLSARFAIDYNAREELDDSIGSAEVIYWPLRQIYIRGGLFAPFEAEDIGGRIGVGVVF